MGSLGIPEMALILGVVVLLFGGKKLPGLGQALGEGIRNFKKGLSEGDDRKPAVTATTDAPTALPKAVAETAKAPETPDRPG